ncbi:MAG: hypothetical protein HC767_08505, partial [Akkermansiaceae bacterium]|nr:hypothetical protein [Akkermansiaceae bacterium]
MPLVKDVKSYERQPMRLVPLKEDGTPDIYALNAEFGEGYLKVRDRVFDALAEIYTEPTFVI